MPWEELSKWALGIIAILLSWVGIDMHRRIKDLEGTRVTRDDFDELRTSMMATFIQGHAALEKAIAQQSQARTVQHEENRETLVRMEQKIDNNEERSAKTRHDILNEVHTLALRVAVMSVREKQ